jgi:GNAT superfamily N-acetyltransferase
VCSREFFGRDFVSILVVAEAARRKGVGSALMETVEQALAGQKLFTSTNQSNTPMQRLLAGRDHVAAGTILYLEPRRPRACVHEGLGVRSRPNRQKVARPCTWESRQ